MYSIAKIIKKKKKKNKKEYGKLGIMYIMAKVGDCFTNYSMSQSKIKGKSGIKHRGNFGNFLLDIWMETFPVL